MTEQTPGKAVIFIESHKKVEGTSVKEWAKAWARKARPSLIFFNFSAVFEEPCYATQTVNTSEIYKTASYPALNANKLYIMKQLFMRQILVGSGHSCPQGRDASDLRLRWRQICFFFQCRFLLQYGAEVYNLRNNVYVFDFLLVSITTTSHSFSANSLDFLQI